MAASGLPAALVSGLVLWMLLATAESYEANTASEANELSFGIEAVFKPFHAAPRRERRFVDVINAITKIGKCDLDVFQGYSGTCASLLYIPYRSDTTKTCRSQIPAFKQCVNALYDRCLQGEMSDAHIKLTKDTFGQLIQNPVYLNNFCDSGSVSPTPPPTVLSFCQSSFNASFVQCVKPFHQKYSSDKASVELCSKYETAHKCVTSLMRNTCSGATIDASLKLAGNLERKSANPFCSESEGGGNVAAILSGNFPVSGASTGASCMLAILIAVSMALVYSAV